MVFALAPRPPDKAPKPPLMAICFRSPPVRAVPRALPAPAAAAEAPVDKAAAVPAAAVPAPAADIAAQAAGPK